MLGEILPDVLDRAVAPLPAGHPPCIPQRDDIYVFLHLFLPWSHTFSVALAPVASLRVRNNTALGPYHYPLGHTAVLVACLCQPDLPAFA